MATWPNSAARVDLAIWFINLFSPIFNFSNVNRKLTEETITTGLEYAYTFLNGWPVLKKANANKTNKKVHIKYIEKLHLRNQFGTPYKRI